MGMKVILLMLQILLIIVHRDILMMMRQIILITTHQIILMNIHHNLLTLQRIIRVET